MTPELPRRGNMSAYEVYELWTVVKKARKGWLGKERDPGQPEKVKAMAYKNKGGVNGSKYRALRLDGHFEDEVTYAISRESVPSGNSRGGQKQSIETVFVRKRMKDNKKANNSVVELKGKAKETKGIEER